MGLLRKDIGTEKSIDVSCLKKQYETIHSLIEWLQDMKKKGGMYLDIGGSKDWEGDIEEVTLQAFLEYTETPEQEKERIEAENAIYRAKEEVDFNKAKETYERLKKKFENN